MIKRILKSDLFSNRYYVLGLAFQKGLPFFVIPLIVTLYGRETYSNFALVCYSVQMLSILFTLGSSSSVIVFWNSYENKKQYLGMQTALSIVITFFFGCIAFYFHRQFNMAVGLLHLHFAMFLIILVFILAYNFSGITISALRALFLSKQYFYSVVISSSLFFVLIAALSHYFNSLVALVLIYIFSLVLQGIACCFFAKLAPKFDFSLGKFWQFSDKMLRYSLPIMFFTIISATTITFDKWLIRAHFSQNVFEQYIFNFQFSYVINVISVVVGMYSLPLFCKFVGENNLKALYRGVVVNYSLVFGVSCLAMIVSWFYAHLTNISLSSGFFILSAAFLFANLYTVNVSLFEAYRFSRALVLIIIIPIILFWVIFYFGMSSKKIILIYCGFLIYNFIMFIATCSIFFIKNINPLADS